VFRERFVPRNAIPSSAFLFPWDGTTQIGNGHGAHLVTVPDGRYVAKLSALRALGDPRDPSDWDICISPVITVARAVAAHAAPALAVGDATAPELALAPSEPNPFADDVALRFELPASGAARLEVFDLQGRRLRAWRWSDLAAGEHRLRWDGRTEAGARAPGGMLVLRLTALDRVVTTKIVRLP
jgi:hypothetical protein